MQLTLSPNTVKHGVGKEIAPLCTSLYQAQNKLRLLKPGDKINVKASKPAYKHQVAYSRRKRLTFLQSPGMCW